MKKEEMKQQQSTARKSELKEYMRRYFEKYPSEKKSFAPVDLNQIITQEYLDGDDVSEINMLDEVMKGPLYLYQRSDLTWFIEYDGLIYHLDEVVKKKVQDFLDDELSWNQLEKNFRFIIDVCSHDELRPEDGYSMYSGLIRGIVDGDPYPLYLFDPDEVFEIF